MAYLLLPYKTSDFRVRPPRWPFELDYASPIASGLVHAFLWGMGSELQCSVTGQQPTDMVGGTPGDFGGRNFEGEITDYNGNQYQTFDDTHLRDSMADAITVLVCRAGYRRTSSGSTWVSFGNCSPTGTSYNWLVSSAYGLQYNSGFLKNASGSVKVVDGPNLWTLGDMRRTLFSMTYDGATVEGYERDLDSMEGGFNETAALTGNVRTATGNSLSIGRWLNREPDGTPYWYLIYNRALEHDEIEYASDRVFPVHREITPRTYFIQSSASGVSVALPISTLSHTAFVPTVGTSALVDVPVSTLTHTSLAPELKFEINVPLSSLVHTSQTPSVSTGIQVSLPTSSLSHTVTSPPVVSGGASVQVPLSSLSNVGLVPTITAGSNVNVIVPLSTLNNVSVSPVISTGIHIDVPLSSLQHTDFDVTVSTGVINQLPLSILSHTSVIPEIATGVALSLPQSSLIHTDYIVTVTAISGNVTYPADEYKITVLSDVQRVKVLADDYHIDVLADVRQLRVQDS